MAGVLSLARTRLLQLPVHHSAKALLSVRAEHGRLACQPAAELAHNSLVGIPAARYASSAPVTVEKPTLRAVTNRAVPKNRAHAPRGGAQEVQAIRELLSTGPAGKEPKEQLAALRTLLQGLSGKQLYNAEQKCRVKTWLQSRAWATPEDRAEADRLQDDIDEWINNYVNEGLPYRDKTHSPGM